MDGRRVCGSDSKRKDFACGGLQPSLSERHGDRCTRRSGRAHADAIYLIPEKVSYEQAAPIFCAGYTVFSGLRCADPKPHERAAVLGIGRLGHLAVQYAKAAGFETIESRD